MAFLIIACSKDKKFTEKPIEADRLYDGMLFKAGLKAADHFGLEVYILSAKHGIIPRTKLIESYDEKLEKAYEGAWPEGDGFYLGSVLYFSNAPERIKPFISKAKPGEMVNLVYRKIESNNLLDYSKPSRGVVAAIFDYLQKEALTKEELYEKLVSEFGPLESMKRTITAQLSPNRMAVEKKCKMNKNESGKYWITFE